MMNKLFLCTEKICSESFSYFSLLLCLNTSVFTMILMIHLPAQRCSQPKWMFNFSFYSYSVYNNTTMFQPTTFLSFLYPQMPSGTTMVRVRPSTLASWSTLPLPWCLWLSSECLTTCLIGRTTTNTSSSLCSTWSGALLSWRYGQ